MRKIITTLLTIFTISSLFAQQDERLKGLEQKLETILEVTKAPGFSIAIVEGDKIIYASGFGYRDYDNKIPADANTLYPIGSVTKAFTSSLLGQLRQEDKISFEDSPVKYLPELKFYNNEMAGSINLKDLMSHRTGLPRHDLSWYMFPSASKDSLISRIRHMEPFTEVRQQWYYNNFMFLVQGVIAERITGKTWEENISERFFQPLGMERSNVSLGELKQASNVAKGYELKKDSIISEMDYYDIAGMSPAGAINSSVNDMAKWLMTWINNGEFNNKQILPEAYVTEAISSQMVIGPGLPSEELPGVHFSNYGFAWGLTSYKGHYRVDHGGNLAGFSANMSFFPTDSIGIIVLSNQNASAAPNLVRNTVADQLLKTSETNWTERFLKQQVEAEKLKEESKSTETPKTAGAKPTHALEDYTGKYFHPGYGRFEIMNRKDSLFADFKLKSFYLKPVHYDIFQPYEVTKHGMDTTETGIQKFNFDTNNSGEISSVRVKIEDALDHPIEFKRQPTLVDVDPATLDKYVGEYEISGMVLKVYTKNNNNLYLFVPGQPEYELLPTSKNEFKLKALEGYSVEFVNNDSKPASEILLKQPNGTFKASRK